MNRENMKMLTSSELQCPQCGENSIIDCPALGTYCRLRECGYQADVHAQSPKKVGGLGGDMEWISVLTRCPEVNGKPVLAYDERMGIEIGIVRFTTECGDCYEGTDNAGEPVWELWSPYDRTTPGTTVIGPLEVSHWMQLPDPPKSGRQAGA